MRKAWCGVAFAVVAVALGGCGLPPAIALASSSADLVSYVETGKSVTDHAYSAVARSDCAMLRVFRGPICFDTAKKTEDDKNAPAAPAVETAQAAPAPGPVPSAPEAAPQEARDSYVAIGSFLDLANAERSMMRYAEFHPAVTKIVVGGLHYNRVVAGPLSADEAATLKARLVAAAAVPNRA